MSADPVSATRAELEAEARGIELAPWFFDDVLAPRLRDASIHMVRRLVSVPPARAWEAISDPTAWTTWTAARSLRVLGGAARAHPGMRIVSRGLLGRRPTAERSTIVRVEDARELLWVTRVRGLGLAGTLELRWSLGVEPHDEGTELRHGLLGAALPRGPFTGPLRRQWSRVADDIPVSMTRGLERLAAAIASRGR